MYCECDVPKSVIAHQRYLFIWFRILGIRPVVLSSSSNKHCEKVSYSINYQIYGYLLALTFIILQGIVLYVELSPGSVRVMKRSQQVLVVSKLLVGLVNAVIIFLTSSKRSRCFIKTLQVVDQIDKRVGNSANNFFDMDILMIITCYLLLAAAVFWSQLSIFTSKRDEMQGWYHYCYIPSRLCDFIALGALHEYALVVKMISTRLIKINTTLTFKMNDHLHAREGFKFNKGTMISAQYREHFTQDFLANLTFCYHTLSDAVFHVNVAYGPFLLISIVLILYQLVQKSFFTLTAVMKSNDLETIFVSTLWLSQTSSQLFVVVESCNNFEHELAKMKIAINKLVVDERCSDEVCKFTAVMLQLPYQFSVCGYCMINRSLLTAIFAATITYLVILYQMNP